MLPDKITPKVDRSIVEHKINNQIEKAKSFLELIIETERQYNLTKEANNNWMQSTKCLLLDLISEVDVVEEFPLFLWSKPYNPDNFYEPCNDFREAINKANEYLRAILDKLEQ